MPDEPTARKLADARNELANQARDAKLRAASSSGFDKFMANLGGEGIKEERTFPIVRDGAETNFRGAFALHATGATSTGVVSSKRGTG